MALPYASPPASQPGTPLSRSRPGTPSKLTRGFSSIMHNIAKMQLDEDDDADNPVVLEKQHLSSARRLSPGGQSDFTQFRIPVALRPYLTTISISIPSSSRTLMLPVPVLVRRRAQHSLSPTTSPRSKNRRAVSRSMARVGSYLPFRLTPLGILFILLLLFLLPARIKRHSYRLKIPFVPVSTNILTDEQIIRVWQWEVGRAHYPSSRRTPVSVNLAGIANPGVDANSWDYHPLDNDSHVLTLPKGPSRFPSGFSAFEALQPVGPARRYLNITNQQALPAGHPRRDPPYPPRPGAGSVIDLDVVMDHCDFTLNKYVRDCLEVLRAGAQLDNQKRLRRGKADDWSHLYLENRAKRDPNQSQASVRISEDGQDVLAGLGYIQKDPHLLSPPEAKAYQTTTLLNKNPSQAKLAESLGPPSLEQRQSIVGFGSSARPHHTHPTADPMCDPDYPRLFHIFWAGPFTDKPYLAVLSFLYTQNLGLHLHSNTEEMEKLLSGTCRPQLWVWINPGPAASLPNPRARTQMFDQLRENPWSAPFLHDRFSQAVKFKMWNTTEQLDNIPEMRDHWRSLPLFNSGGVKYGGQPQSVVEEQSDSTSAQADDGRLLQEQEEEEAGRFGTDAAGDIDQALAVKGQALNATAIPESAARLPAGITAPSKPKKGKQEEMLNRIGSTSSKGYDRLTVVLSDMARFVLTHRYGGIYLDADTIFLRDWEELWGWKGAFAYRWSRLEKYNTAVLRMHRNSAIGSFLFKSALANGLDFHPMTISKYTKDANLEGLLLRLPDALFDSAWLNTEYYQRDRPAFPYFKRFEDFFDTPKEDSAAPLMLGFDGFFRGAFSYHFHNFWWIPFDPARNWPDLGARFAGGERKAREKAAQDRLSQEPSGTAATMALRGLSRSRSLTPLNMGGMTGQTGASNLERATQRTSTYTGMESIRIDDDDVNEDIRDPSWATVLKRTFEAYVRGERPNMYGEWLRF